MRETIEQMLAVGGKTNSLGRAPEVIELVLADKSQLDELYDCLFAEDPWVRMRAIDSIEKICRLQPDWIIPYVDKFIGELSSCTQPSIQWHLAQMYSQLNLSKKQREAAIEYLQNLLSTKDVDWIVSANSMDTLMHFANNGQFSYDELERLIKIQLHHKSNAVIKKAIKLLDKLPNK